MWKNVLIEHNGYNPEFEMKVLKSFNSCLECPVNEAVRIISTKAEFKVRIFSCSYSKDCTNHWPTGGAGGHSALKP